MVSLLLDRYHFDFLMILKETLTFVSLSGWTVFLSRNGGNGNTIDKYRVCDIAVYVYLIQMSMQGCVS